MTSVELFFHGLIFIPIISAVLIYIFSNSIFNYFVFVVQAIVTVIAVVLFQEVIKNGVLTLLIGGWQKEIGVELRLDNLAMLFIAMAIIIWWVLLIYVWYKRKHDSKYFFFLLFLEGSFMALLLTNDFFTLFILIEIVTIISSILILYKKDGMSVKAGLYYLLFNGFGMMIYLFGLALLYLKTGTLNMTLVREYLIQTDVLSNTYSVVKVSYACFVVAMCVKAAQFPVYEWLPRAHTAAPAGISALLSGLLVKTGIFGLIRVMYVFQVDSIYKFLFYLGFFTAISGIIFAVSHIDIKAILAFHTISQIGLITMSIAANSDIGLIGAYAHIFNHFLFKSLLFLGAGIIINEYGVRRVTEIRGIGRAHPILTVCMFIGIFAITGAPLSIGFLSKYLIKSTMENQIQTIMFQIVSIGTIISFIKFSVIFTGKPEKDKKIRKQQLSAMVMLAALCIFVVTKEMSFIPAFLAINNQAITANVSETIANVNNAFFNIKYLLEYLIMVLIAFVIFKTMIRTDSKFFSRIRHFRMKFQDAIISLVFFIIIVIRVVG